MVVKTAKSEESRNMIQCTVVGDGMVGKTCLSLAFSKLSAPHDYVATVFDNYAGKTNVNGDEYTVSIFDSAGQHDYASLRQFTYEDSEVFVVCFSAVDRDSFESVKEFWVPEMKPNMTRKKPIVLVATQTDLRNTAGYDSDMPVSKTEGESLAKAIGAVTYVECSIQHHQSVKKLFSEVAQAALKYRKKKTNIVNKLLGR
ncbi:cell division control protein 42 homolog [Mercenaria mercenaria]|uniref:cell division control protein 42 homolog n=1 Tax=Mercenaria mercenaria TaxID=6596 RepID=UPI001E1E1745|nr:cell division control protein 42 homolog [Mercenaria mercenaria]